MVWYCKEPEPNPSYMDSPTTARASLGLGPEELEHLQSYIRHL